MRTTLTGLPFLPGDDQIKSYEEAVLQVSIRRVIKIIFMSTKPVPISHILRVANISLNSLVGVYFNLSSNGYVEYQEGGLFLNHAGRRWVIKKRKEIFMKRIRVRTNPPRFEGNLAYEKATNEIAGKPLPSAYTLPRR